MNAMDENQVPLPAAGALIKPVRSAAANDMLARLIPSLGIGIAALTLILGVLSITANTYEKYPVPMLVGACVFLQIFFLTVYLQCGKWDVTIGVFALIALASVFLLRALPEYITGLQLNVIIHRSIFSALCLFVVGIGSLTVSIYYVLGATPSAEDLSRYPLILFPVLVAVTCYIVFIIQLITRGTLNWSWDVITRPYFDYAWPVKTIIAGDWPKWVSEIRSQAGILNNILGTGLLMLVTTLIALPVGLGAGIYLSEYGNNDRFAKTARFLIFSLRSISILVLGLSAFSLIQLTKNTPLHAIFQGNSFTGYETVYAGGSYLTAGLILALLVIPIITRATEEGCHSLPLELREGSIALGAPEETTLFRVVIPWALPNIVTAVLLGCAEAAGSVAVLIFIAGRGQYGVGLFQQVTSLDYLIYDIFYGDRIFQGAMAPYQYTAGVVLLAITMTLGILAIVLKRWLVKNHRGG